MFDNRIDENFSKYTEKRSRRNFCESSVFLFLLSRRQCTLTLAETYALGMVTLSSFQISSTYCWMVRSEVNLPLQAIFRIAILAQRFSSL